MRTIKGLEFELKELELSCLALQEDIRNSMTPKALKSKLSRLKKQKAVMKLCLDYLKTEPREEFVKKEVKKLTTLQASIHERWKEEHPNRLMMGKDKSAEYRKYEVPHILKQIKTLKFLLS